VARLESRARALHRGDLALDRARGGDLFAGLVLLDGAGEDGARALLDLAEREAPLARQTRDACGRDGERDAHGPTAQVRHARGARQRLGLLGRRRRAHGHAEDVDAARLAEAHYVARLQLQHLLGRQLALRRLCGGRRVTRGLRGQRLTDDGNDGPPLLLMNVPCVLEISAM
jgi:hypothetical protein